MQAAVAYSAKARQDLRREWNHLLTKAGPAIADTFLDAMEQTSGTLLNSPRIGALCGFKTPRARLLRRFPVSSPFGNWLVFYQSTPDGIIVERIAHGARDLNRFFGQ